MATTKQLMYAQMGLSAIEGFASYGVAVEQAKMDDAVTAYNNHMAELAAAGAHSEITRNALQARDADVRSSIEIQQQEIEALGEARVAAGAAHVAGGSVSAVMQGLKSQAARAHYARMVNTETQMNAFSQERRNTNQQLAAGKDVTVTRQPSVAEAMLGVGANLLKIVDKYAAPTNTVKGRLTRNK